jgi:hypothetical protein
MEMIEITSVKLEENLPLMGRRNVVGVIRDYLLISIEEHAAKSGDPISRNVKGNSDKGSIFICREGEVWKFKQELSNLRARTSM